MDDDIEFKLYELGYDKHGKKWFVRTVNFPPDYTDTTLELIEEKDLYKANNYHVTPRAECKLWKEKNNTLTINDIEIIDKTLEDRGIGTLLITFVEKLARSQNLSKLFGELSKVDANHFNKLKHFYKKLGFNLILYEPPRGIYIGYVEKHLA